MTTASRDNFTANTNPAQGLPADLTVVGGLSRTEIRIKLHEMHIREADAEIAKILAIQKWHRDEVIRLKAEVAK